MNSATAAGVLGGEVQAKVTTSSCEFVRQSGTHEIALRIEVGTHAQCGPGAEPLKAIGNAAVACAYQSKDGWIGEQVTGRVRDQSFLVRVSTNDRSVAAKTLREKARNVAEQVAGVLF